MVYSERKVSINRNFFAQSMRFRHLAGVDSTSGILRRSRVDYGVPLEERGEILLILKILHDLSIP